MSQRGKALSAVYLAAFVIVGALASAPARSQARYEEHDTLERFYLRLGGFNQRDIDSTLRIDSKILGLGTIVDLENDLAMEDEVTVARIDGFYRFNKRHRLGWTWYRTRREGTAIAVRDIQIGDEIFPVGAEINSHLDFETYKVGYSWSFINVKKYEFYIGAGLDASRVSLKFTGETLTGEEVETLDYRQRSTLPLPTVAFGGRFNITDKFKLRFRTEVFSLEFGEFEGTWRDTLLLGEYNFGKNVGAGGGLNFYDINLKLERDSLRGVFDTSYTGFLLYLKTYF